MQKYLTIGIAGHVDHGKTSLVRCLTGIDTDRLREEKRRGLSIESGIAPLELSVEANVALVDVPGHTDFFKNTIRGLSSVDLALLVIAADDSVMPQTLEHLEILNFYGAKDGFIVLSKADLVDEETLELAEMEIREMTEDSFLEEKPIIPFSAVDRKGLEDIRQNLERLVAKATCKDPGVPFRLWIDQIKSFQGFGTVASGTILSGTLREDDPIHILPLGIETRARSLESHHKKASEARAGERVGISLHKVPLHKIERGMVLAQPGSLDSTYLLNADLRILKSADKPIKNRQRVKLYLGTSVTNTMTVTIEKNHLNPGERGLVQLRSMKPVAALPNDPFVLCPLNVQTVLGGGRVLEIPRQKFRQARASSTISYLKALQENQVEEFIDHVFKNNPNFLLTPAQLARNTVFPMDEIQAEIRKQNRDGRLISFKDRGIFRKERYQELKGEIPEVVGDILQKNPLKTNVNAEEIKNQLSPFLDEAPFQRMLAELCNEGKLIKTNGGFRSHNISVDLPPEQARIVSAIMDYAFKSGFTPFSADTIWKLHNRKWEKKQIVKLCGYLRNQDKLVRLRDGRFLLPGIIEQVKERVQAVIEDRGVFTLGDLKEHLGYGRIIGVTVLEYLDAIGFTRREEQGRVLKK